ncbi:MAG: HAMP domain-containing histidine kinase [Methylacidiphilales bacterium]|nr:HAMP domain-containing histidine kinase [Candidatus Methylacidiphilales bacterium]
MKSLRFRLALAYMLVVTLTVASVLGIGRWLLEVRLIRGIDFLNHAEFQEIQNRIVDRGVLIPRSELLQRISEHSVIDAPLYFFQVSKQNGNVIFRSDNLKDAVLPNPPGNKTAWSCSVPPFGSMRAGSYVVGDLNIEIATSTKNIDALFSDYFQVSLVLIGFVVIFGLIWGFWMSRLALSPIRSIQRTARRISANNLGERIAVDEGEGEIGDLKRLLNQMFDRLESSFDRLWRFAGDASHELKTPLILIRLQSERLLLHSNLSAPDKEAVQQQLENINRLNTVIEKLLFLAKSEVGAISLNLQTQPTQPVIAGFAEDAQVLCEDRQVIFRLVENDDLRPAFNSTLIRQVLLNLVTNALNALPSGGEIGLSSRLHSSNWEIILEDSGPGLPAHRLKEVFEPFVRVDQGASQDQDAGSGLGLAICRRIINLHGGSIRLENRVDQGGLRAIVEIPLTR